MASIKARVRIEYKLGSFKLCILKPTIRSLGNEWREPERWRFPDFKCLDDRYTYAIVWIAKIPLPPPFTLPSEIFYAIRFGTMRFYQNIEFGMRFTKHCIRQFMQWFYTECCWDHVDMMHFELVDGQLHHRLRLWARIFSSPKLESGRLFASTQQRLRSKLNAFLLRNPGMIKWVGTKILLYRFQPKKIYKTFTFSQHSVVS